MSAGVSPVTLPRGICSRPHGGTLFIHMEHNYKPLLTEAESNRIEELHLNPDPTSRLRSNYYLLRHRQIIDTFSSAFKDGVDANDRLRYQTEMADAMHQLKKEYEADLNHAIALHLATYNCWIPWGKAEVA